jgi:hypothetical protein
MALPGWYSSSAVVEIHATLQGIAVIFFVALVVFDVLAHIYNKNHLLERIALICFAIAGSCGGLCVSIWQKSGRVVGRGHCSAQ